MGRPTKKDQVLKDERNKKIVSMRKSGYPLIYIAATFNVSKSRISRILKKAVDNIKNEK